MANLWLAFVVHLREFFRVKYQLLFLYARQVYGPIRIGIQSSFSFDANEEISTDYFIEYSRRPYDLLLRYNPILQVGSFNLRISDFNWSGNPGPFEGTGIRPVIQGVTRWQWTVISYQLSVKFLTIKWDLF